MGGQRSTIELQPRWGSQYAGLINFGKPPLCRSPSALRYNPAMEAQTPAITIFVNGEPTRVAGDCTLARLIASLDVGQRRIAVELNEDVVPRSEHASRQLRDHDRIEIIRAIGGG